MKSITLWNFRGASNVSDADIAGAIIDYALKIAKK